MLSQVGQESRSKSPRWEENGQNNIPFPKFLRDFLLFQLFVYSFFNKYLKSDLENISEAAEADSFVVQ